MKGGILKTQKSIFAGMMVISLFLCGIIAFWSPQANANEWTEAQKEVWKSVEVIWENSKQGDANAVMAIFHDDCVIWRSTVRLPVDKYKMTLLYRAWLTGPDKPVSYELEPLSIHIFGNVANVYYIYTWGTKKEPKYNRVRSMQTFLKQDNKWMVIGTMNALLH